MIKKILLISVFALTPAHALAINWFGNGDKPAEKPAQAAVEKPAEKPVEKNGIIFLDEKEVAKYKKTIARVEEYLSGISTITSDFMQVAPDGSLTSGKFFLERPGRMRWQYNPPTPILMVANGSQLVYYDYELEQVSYIPLDSTLIGFLAQKEIKFDKSVGIISYSQGAGVIRIGVAQRDKPTDGQLVLELSDKPLLIRNMVVTDATGQVTTVSLNKANFGAKIDKELFDFRDPRKGKNDR